MIMTVILETFLQLVDKLEFYRLPRGVMVMSYFKSKTMGSTGGAGIADSFGSPEFMPVY
jgi:hypothetical protein